VASKVDNVSASGLAPERATKYRMVSVTTVHRGGVMRVKPFPALSRKPQNSAQAIKMIHQRRKIIYLLVPATNRYLVRRFDPCLGYLPVEKGRLETQIRLKRTNRFQ
jgi:hypothetical protein